MSILLCGDFKNNLWTGKWYFAKNQINSKEFKYSRLSLNISKNIFDYISFNTITTQTKQRGRKKNKLKDIERYCNFNEIYLIFY